MTPREAYDTDFTFRALIDLWVVHKRCPLVLVDRCLELDMPRPAEACRWAATEPDRPQWGGAYVSGPFPCIINSGKPYWLITEFDRYRMEHDTLHANCVPRDLVARGFSYPPINTDVVTVLLNLLECWL